MIKTYKTILIFLLTSIFSPVSALTFNAIQDANVYDRATDPVGDTILAPFSPTSYTNYAYIKFDISSFTNQNILASDVSLDLFTGSSVTNLSLDIYGLNDNVTDIWTENVVDKNNAPGLLPLSSGKITGVDTAATTTLFNSNISYSQSTTVSFSNSGFVDFINADTNGIITFILTQPLTTSTNHAFTSNEFSGGSNGPILSITAVPLPAAVWLLGSGLVGLTCFRKKKTIL